MVLKNREKGLNFADSVALQRGTEPRIYVSNLNREEASRYNRLHTNRLISTTTVAMISVDASSTSNLPESLARLMVLPRPAVKTILP
jgi:hypothetical protein